MQPFALKNGFFGTFFNLVGYCCNLRPEPALQWADIRQISAGYPASGGVLRMDFPWRQDGTGSRLSFHWSEGDTHS